MQRGKPNRKSGVERLENVQAVQYELSAFGGNAWPTGRRETRGTFGTRTCTDSVPLCIIVVKFTGDRVYRGVKWTKTQHARCLLPSAMVKMCTSRPLSSRMTICFSVTVSVTAARNKARSDTTNNRPIIEHNV